MRKSCRMLAAIGAVAWIYPVPGFAAPLDEVLIQTYQTNPTLSAGRSRLRATDETVPQARSGWRPSVTVTGSAGQGSYFDNSVPTNFQASRRPLTAALSVSQPVYDGGRTTAATNQAEANVLAERAQLVATEQSVLLSAVAAYLDVVRDEAVLKLSLNNEEVLRRQLEATQERFRVGEITRTDVSQAEARLAKAIADRVGAEGTLKSSRANYFNAVGAEPEALQQPAPPPGLPARLDEAIAAALAFNPAVLKADHAIVAAREAIDQVEGELLPSVSLNANLSRGYDTATMGKGADYSSNAKEVLLNVSVPLYEGGGTYARLRAAKHTAGQRVTEADQARRDVTETITAAWESLQSARAQARSYEAQIVASDLALSGVREESKVGSRTVLDVLNAEQEVFDARVALVRAQHDVLSAAYQVKSALGGLTVRGMNLPVESYDPTKHYDQVRGKWIGTSISSGSDQGQD